MEQNFRKGKCMSDILDRKKCAEKISNWNWHYRLIYISSNAYDDFNLSFNSITAFLIYFSGLQFASILFMFQILISNFYQLPTMSYLSFHLL